MNILDLTVHGLRDLIKNKQISSYEATTACLSQIRKCDETIGSFIDVFYDDALSSAKSADKKIASGDFSCALLGIPYALKDNILTKGIRTTCASKMLKDFIPPYSATVYERLKNSGAILLGKLNMDEFAMGSSCENSAYKITKNPYDTTKIPGGSSGGSATSVATDEVYFSLGSDTGGSIRQPAAFCGQVGIKPTYGRVSRFGLVAFASSLDQIGPVTKDVKDAAIILDIISGKDEKDPTTAPVNQEFESTLTGNISDIKIGVPTQYLDGVDDEIKFYMFDALENLKSLGADTSLTEFKLYKYALPAYYLISSGEAISNLSRYDGVKYGFRQENAKNLDDLYKESRTQGFGDEVKRRIMLGSYILSSENYSVYYEKAQKVRTLIIDEFNKLFEKFDVLVTPAYPTTPGEIGSNATSLEMYKGGNCLACANLAGLPAIVLPCGYDKSGLPIGIQIIGKQFDESTILNVAYALEKTIKKQKPTLIGGAL